MFGSEILDVAIGLIMVFLVLSLICSSAREAVETVFKHRAKDLERGIREMLGQVDGAQLTSEFYKQPLINGLFKGPYNPNRPGDLPSYIPSQTFALAVISITKKLSNKAELSDAIASLPEGSNLKGALTPLLVAAEGNATRFRQNLENWYDASMDRVSGWYKRRTQIIIALFGFTIAAVLNVNTISIVRYLNTNQTARSVLIAEAQRAAKNSPEVNQGDAMTFLTRQGGLPVGWLFRPEQNQTGVDFMRDWRRAPTTPHDWLLKFIGILFTGFAISLGAPFWFDVLNRVMVIRSTVKPQEKSAEEPSKDA